ncbi:MAG: head GIN domain-containing protein [Bacteroidota bacterium]
MIKIITLITKFIVATLIALFFSSCGSGIKGSGTITTENRIVTEDFKNIEVSNGIEVIIEQSDNKSITVEADDNLQEHIITKIENGVLKIKSDENYNSTETPIVNVKTPVIRGLKANSGSEITSQNVLVTENMNVKSDSGSKISIDVEADFIKIESASGSKIEVSGKALKSETSSTSGSKINAENLMTNEVIAKAESGSKTSIYPIVKLEAKASSGGNISYHKTPKSVSKEENSGGSVAEE